jgi:hypothetical protein
MPDDPVVPDTCDNGELQPDARRPSGGTEDERAHGHRIQHHNRPITATTDPGGEHSGS